ncbi:MAG TPA: MBL fold metallo-hydrolase [Thermoflexia bacterium]|nr:MBL fold metallo-hydrolase [Thermoflexia bacterium]
MIISLPFGLVNSNIYLVYDKEQRDGLIVDTGGDQQLVIEEVAQRKLKIHYILNTHGHFDHIAANAPLKATYAVPLGIHPADRELLLAGGGAALFGLPHIPSPSPELELTAGLTLQVGRWKLQVIHTPGHTPGSVCFYLPGERAVLTGDTLFAGSVGRTDLPGGNSRQLTASLRRLLELPPETAIYPGHGPQSTLARELRENPWLRRLR